MGTGAELFKLYPEIEVNYDPRSHNGDIHKHLYAAEPLVIMPGNWMHSIVSKFKTYITYNEKVPMWIEPPLKKAPSLVEPRIIKVHGCIAGDLDGWSSNLKTYDKKIKGVCILGKNGHKARMGNIYFLREELTTKLYSRSKLVTHIYAHKSYGRSHYQGNCKNSPWSIEAIDKVSEYLFNFCPENTYHPLWSYGYFTERIFRCFRAKTIPIYIGCYNIEDYVPKDLFIDFRDFYVENPDEDHRELSSCTAYDRLADYLVNFPKEKYIEMTEKAFEWEKKRTFHTLEELEKAFNEAVGESQ